MFDVEGTYLDEWGDWGSGEGEFDAPLGLSFADEMLYVTDSSNNRIQTFDFEGTYLSQFGGDFGRLNQPKNVAVSEDGIVYVADSYNCRIQVFDLDGLFVTQWGECGAGEGQMYNPGGIAVDADGNVYVSDMGNQRIEVFDSEGGYITLWGESGDGEGEFANPNGVAIYNDRVYIVDGGNHRIQVFDLDGEYITQWGENGDGEGEFYYPQSIGIGGTGEVYVVDTNNNRIQVFDSDGVYLRQWGEEGSNEGQFDYPCGITVAEDGNVYVADSWNGRIQVFDSEGTFLTMWGSSGGSEGQFNGPTGLAVYSDGRVYVADAANNRVQVFGYSTLVTAGYSSADRVVSPSSPGVLDAFGMSFAQDGQYWITDLSETDGGYDSQVFKLDPGSSCVDQSRLSVSWTGHGDESEDSLVYISMWNFNSASWEQLSSQHCADDCTLSGFRTGADYRDGEGYVWVWVKADNDYSAPPEITNVVGTEWDIRWNTDVPATSQVVYDSVSHAEGGWEDYAYRTVEGLELVEDHVVWPDYPSTGTWYFRVRSCNENHDCSTSEEYSLEYEWRSSCPFIFTYNGSAYEFVVDASVSGRLGSGLTTEQWAQDPFYKEPNSTGGFPNPLSFTKFPHDALVPRSEGGETYYDLRNTTELNEVNYYDASELYVVDHDPSVDVFPDYRNNGEIHSISKASSVPVSVIDQDGNDVMSLVSAEDDVYYHSPLTLTLSYLDIKFSNDETTPEHVKIAIKQGKEGSFVGYIGVDKLQYKNEYGDFVDVPPEYDIFNVTREGASEVSRNLVPTHGVDTEVIDLSGLSIRDNTIRFVTTNNKRMWDIDWLAVDTNPDAEVQMTKLSPYSADLHYRGVSRMVLTNPTDSVMKLNEPLYSDVSTSYLSAPLTGNATRYGDVTDLLADADDQYVIMTQGDELSMKFSVPPLGEGLERDFVSSVWNFHKPYIYALGDTIDPLPFNEMTQYPYHTMLENYPYTENQSYIDEYNTRHIDWRPAQPLLNTNRVASVETMHRSVNTDDIDLVCTYAPSPTIVLDPSSTDQIDDSTPTITGTATASSGTVQSVEFQVDGTIGPWIPCTALDGAFDEASEAFICEVTTPLSDGDHTVYFRSTDSEENLTPPGSEVLGLITIGGLSDTGDGVQWAFVLGVIALGGIVLPGERLWKRNRS